MAERETELSIVLRAKDLASATIKRLGPTATTAGRLASTAFERVGRAARAATSFVGGIGRAFGSVGRSLRLLVPGVGQLAALLGGGLALAKLTRDAAAFSTAMAEVSTIVDTARVNMAALRGGVLELAKAQGLNEQVVAKGLYQAISAGIGEGADALAFLGQASKLAVAGVADTEQAVDLLSSTLNAYNLSIDQTGRLSDVFFTTVRRGKTTIPELSGAMAQVTPIAASLGVEIEELTAAIATITLSGTPTAEAVTQVRAALLALLKGTETIGPVLAKVGVAFDDNTIRSQGLVKTLEQLRNAVGGSETALTQLLGRAEATSAVLNLTGRNAERFNSVLGDIVNSAGAAGVAFDKQMADPAKRAAVTLNALRIRFTEVGHAIINAAGQAIEMAGGMERLEANIGIVSDVLAELVGSGVRGLGRMLETLDRVIDAMGGTESVTRTMIAVYRVFTASLDIAFQTIVHFLGELPTIASQSARAAANEMKGIFGKETQQQIQRDLDTIDDLLEQFPRDSIQLEFAADIAGFPLTRKRLLELRDQLQRDIKDAPLDLGDAFKFDFDAQSPGMKRAKAGYDAAIKDLFRTEGGDAGKGVEGGFFLAAAIKMGAVAGVDAAKRELDRLKRLAAGLGVKVPITPELDPDAERDVLASIERFNAEVKAGLFLAGQRVDLIEPFNEMERALAEIELQAVQSKAALSAFFDQLPEGTITPENFDQFKELLDNIDRIKEKQIGIAEAGERVREAGKRFEEFAHSARLALDPLNQLETQLLELELRAEESRLSIHALFKSEQITATEFVDALSRVNEELEVMSDRARDAFSFEGGIKQALASFETLKNALGQQLVGGTFDAFRGFFNDIATGAMSAGEAIEEFAKRFLSNIADMIAQMLAFNAVKGIFGSFGFPVPGSASAKGNVFSAGRVIPSALGNVIQRGALVPFARGGIFQSGLADQPGIPIDAPKSRSLIRLAAAGLESAAPALAGSFAKDHVMRRGALVAFARGDIVTRPTLFPMARGATGLMGEAGPEAVMPLAQARGGRLGVRAMVEGARGVMERAVLPLRRLAGGILGVEVSRAQRADHAFARGGAFSLGRVERFQAGGVFAGSPMSLSREREERSDRRDSERVIAGPSQTVNLTAPITLNVGSLDPRGAAHVILSNMRAIEDGIAAAVITGTNRGLRTAIRGA